MAVKQFQIDGVGQISVYKRRGAKRIKLSVDHNGTVKLSMPTWVPYRTAIGYASSKREWLILQVSQYKPNDLRHGQRIGLQYQLMFEPYENDSTRSRILHSKQIRIQYPQTLETGHPDVQAAAARACVRALRTEAEELLPERLRQLAAQHDLRYRSFGVRQLKGRWGSCDSEGHITINLFVMQLPSLLREYVLLHELAHTEYLDHSADFWKVLLLLDPLAKEHRKQLRAYRPVVNSGVSGENQAPVAY